MTKYKIIGVLVTSIALAFMAGCDGESGSTQSFSATTSNNIGANNSGTFTGKIEGSATNGTDTISGEADVTLSAPSGSLTGNVSATGTIRDGNTTYNLNVFINSSGNSGATASVSIAF